MKTGSRSPWRSCGWCDGKSRTEPPQQAERTTRDHAEPSRDPSRLPTTDQDCVGRRRTRMWKAFSPYCRAKIRTPFRVIHGTKIHSNSSFSGCIV